MDELALANVISYCRHILVIAVIVVSSYCYLDMPFFLGANDTSLNNVLLLTLCGSKHNHMSPTVTQNPLQVLKKCCYRHNSYLICWIASRHCMHTGGDNKSGMN